MAEALRGKRERALGWRCPRWHGPLARLHLGRLGRARFLAPAGPVYLENTPWVCSKNPRLPEAVVTLAGGVGEGLAEDDVVEEVDFHGFGGFAQRAGHADVGRTGGGVARRVVVGAEDGRGGFLDGLAEDLARVGEGAAGGSRGDLGAFDQAVFAIQAKHPELLDQHAVGERAQEPGGLVRAVDERWRMTAGVGEHATGYFHDGNELKGFHVPDALEFFEIGLAPVDEPGERAGLLDQAIGQGEHVMALGSTAQQHGEQFAVAEGTRAEFFETLLRAVAGGEGLKAVGRIHGK
jgi:hypothetical protein